MQNNFQSLLRKANKKEKSNSPKKKTVYKIKVKRNSFIKLSKKGKDKLSFYKQCITKTGIINIILNRPFSPINMIVTTPVFVIITKNKLFVYRDLKKTKLIHSIKIEDIQRVDQHYENTLCFDIIINKIDKKKVLTTGPLSFCAVKKEEFNKWLKSILEFKQCSINIKNVESRKILIDFNRINYSKKIGPAENTDAGIYYDGEHRFYKKKSLKEQKNDSLNVALETLKKDYIRNRLLKRMIRRQFAGKMKSSTIFKESFEKKFLKIGIEKRFNAEKEKEFMELRKINHSKELGMILSTIHELNEIKRMEIINFKKEMEEKVRKQIESNNEEAKHLLHIKLNEQKLTNFKECYSNQLLGFKDKKYVNKLCKHYYGETGYKLCRKKSSFCVMCCEFHIGSSYPKKRVVCRMKCNKIIHKK